MVWVEEGEQFVLIRQHVDMLLDSERSTMEAVVVVDNASSSLRSAGAAAPPPFEAKVTSVQVQENVPTTDVSAPSPATTPTHLLGEVITIESITTTTTVTSLNRMQDHEVNNVMLPTTPPSVILEAVAADMKTPSSLRISSTQPSPPPQQQQ